MVVVILHALRTKNLFSGIRNSNEAVLNILCGRSGASVTARPLVRVVFLSF